MISIDTHQDIGFLLRSLSISLFLLPDHGPFLNYSSTRTYIYGFGALTGRLTTPNFNEAKFLWVYFVGLTSLFLNFRNVQPF